MDGNYLISRGRIGNCCLPGFIDQLGLFPGNPLDLCDLIPHVTNRSTLDDTKGKTRNTQNPDRPNMAETQENDAINEGSYTVMQFRANSMTVCDLSLMRSSFGASVTVGRSDFW